MHESLRRGEDGSCWESADSGQGRAGSRPAPLMLRGELGTLESHLANGRPSVSTRSQGTPTCEMYSCVPPGDPSAGVQAFRFVSRRMVVHTQSTCVHVDTYKYVCLSVLESVSLRLVVAA